MNKKLFELEKTGNCVFHGSGTPGIKVFEPRQAYTEKNGIKIPDDKPAVHATPIADIAIFMAIVNKQTLKGNFYSSFFTQNSIVHLQATKQTIDQLKEVKGFVYVFDKKDFATRNTIEAICYKEVKPIDCIEVIEIDLGRKIEIIKDPME